MSASLVRATVRAVSKRKLQPTRAALTLTPSAVNKIKQLLKDKPEHVGVKVGVRTRGCNGLSYTLEYTKTKGDSDEEVIQDGSRKARGILVAHCGNCVTVTCWKIK
ncbi:iron-sulfur cluster assembly 1 homolog, mitochondrial isoform X3 [Rhinopithecus roxellana]|uniref:iron-sulfur cluster assembly 1 homolog, mitochondrial isoform X3 n=1 Tax=Rhinopithecus roxellana TaxID=61622 RepID=UPI0012376C14|nr:iron-sulfur cluster assembly 1 homolog, mitochondrial isoform X3 [Rhinopithecus roxellana]